jgi:hypothetical protein
LLLLSTSQRQGHVKASVTRAIGVTAAIAAVGLAAVISVSRAVALGGDQSVSPERENVDGINTLVIDDPTPPPITCNPCATFKQRSENFDEVTPPALPPQWLATNAQGPPPLWVASNSGLPKPPADTFPNALFVDDPAVVSDKRLDGWFFDTFENFPVRLTFRHNFNLEASEADPNLGFDGGVLEVSTDGGNTFEDIVDAGCRFEMNGYNRTIATDRGSPIAGRQAWSGTSGGFITTVVNISPGLDKGEFRWRMASDMSGAGEGWRVDTLEMTWCNQQGTPCPTPTPVTTPTASPTPTPSPRATPRPRPTPHPRPMSPR